MVPYNGRDNESAADCPFFAQLVFLVDPGKISLVTALIPADLYIAVLCSSVISPRL